MSVLGPLAVCVCHLGHCVCCQGCMHFYICVHSYTHISQTIGWVFLCLPS